jgi:tRNA(adenine34) deaminase
MKAAITQAQKAFDEGEVPVGAVIVDDQKQVIVASGFNKTGKNPLMHAEMIAIQEAIANEVNLRVCSIYITLEPCLMCVGAISISKIKRVFYSLGESKQGGIERLGCGDHIDTETWNGHGVLYKPEVYEGICRQESINLLQKFFKNKR